MVKNDMPRVVFTPNIQRHVACPETAAAGGSVREVLDNTFAQLSPHARGYVLDDQGGLRKHISVYVSGELIRDRQHLTDPVGDDATVYVFQALSGG